MCLICTNFSQDEEKNVCFNCWKENWKKCDTAKSFDFLLFTYVEYVFVENLNERWTQTT